MPDRSTFLKALAVLALGAAAGCAAVVAPGPSEPCDPTPIHVLHSFCFSGAVDCEEYCVDALLYLDTGTLPSCNMGIRTLVLSDVPTTPTAIGDRLGFFFEGDLDPAIDPGILGELGWKLHLRHVRIRYCDNCYCNSGLVEIIDLEGTLADVDFVSDPDDTLEIYIQRFECP